MTMHADVAEPRLRHLPITFFGATIGLAGLALAWGRASSLLGAPELIGRILFWVALASFLVLLAAYLTKGVVYPEALRAETRHPVRLAFLSTPGITLVLLAAAGQDLVPRLAEVLWWAGVGTQLPLTLFVISAWLSGRHFSWAHVTPAWFIPVVGLTAAPLAGARFAPEGISWFFLATGVVFWMSLLPLVLGRLIFHDDQLPAKLAPTMAILIAPPAVILLAYLRLVPDPFATPIPQAVYGVAVFFAMIVAIQAPALSKAPFALSAWAYSFPLAALAVATIVMADHYGGALLYAGWTMIVVVSAIIAALVVRTAVAIAANAICVPE